MSISLVADKLEIQKQWDVDPCGAVTAAAVAPESLEYYRSIRAFRYEVYAPWLAATVPFADWTGRDILEVGVGMGSDHYRFASRGNRMTALDLSRTHLHHTTTHLAKEGLQTRPIYGDAESMPFEDASFDAVYAFGVLHHTPDTDLAIREVRRVLRPGGTALLSFYHRDSVCFLNFLILRGLVHGGLWRESWRDLLSQIEYRESPDSARPLVKVYGRARLRSMFREFASVDIASRHVQLGRFQQLCPLSRPRLEALFSRWGWYLCVKATK